MTTVLLALALCAAATPHATTSSATLTVGGLSPGEQAFLDGDPLREPEAEIAVPAGAHSVEVRGGPVIRLFSIELAPGEQRRMAIQPTSDAARAASSVIALDGARDRLESLAIDGVLVRGAVNGAYLQLWLEPGDHRLEVEDSEAQRRTISVRFDPGGTTSLVELFTTIAPIGGREGEGDGIDSLDFRHSMALVSGGVGVTAGVIGAILLAGAASTRDIIDSAPRDELGRVMALSMRQAARHEEDARVDSRVGGLLIAGGSAVLGAAVILWLTGGDPQGN